MRRQADHGHPVEAGDRAEQRARVEVVGEQPARGGEDAGAEVAGGQLTQLTGEDGRGERRKVGAEERDAVALQEGADGVQPLLDGGGDGPRVHDDHVSVLIDQGLDRGEGTVQRLSVEVGENGGGQGALVLRRQRQVGSGHGNGCWHAQLPDSRGPAHRRYSGAPG